MCPRALWGSSEEREEVARRKSKHRKQNQRRKMRDSKVKEGVVIEMEGNSI